MFGWSRTLKCAIVAWLLATTGWLSVPGIAQTPPSLFAAPGFPGQPPSGEGDTRLGRQTWSPPRLLPPPDPVHESELHVASIHPAEEIPVLSPQGQPTRHWWDHEVTAPLEQRPEAVKVDVGTLMQMVIQCSAQVKAVGISRWIRQEQTTIAEAEFDPEFYSNGRFDDSSDPVGNALTTGGPSRLNEHDARFDTGLRRKLRSGASFSLSQQLGFENSNSLFFTPNNQGNSRMALALRQPLLEGRGCTYNQSFVVETVFQSEQAEAEYLQALQDRLFEVGAAYWSLYRARATLVQQRRNIERAVGIAEELEHRQIFDSHRSQVLRAKAAVATRQSDLAVTAAEIYNSESRIRSLINVASLECEPMPELLPSQLPPDEEFSVSLAPCVSEALSRRPEMRLLAAQLRVADVRTAQATNETQPSLDLILESYVSGLAGESQVGEAWKQQFTEGAPSYAVGLQFSTPLGNRAAQAKLRQRQFDQSRVRYLLRDQSDRIRSEVEIAMRNVSAAYQTAQAREIAVEAINAEMDYLNERWIRLRGDANLGQLQLDDLLNAQVRLFEEEKALATAQAAYGVALLELQKSTGVLVRAAR